MSWLPVSLKLVRFFLFFFLKLQLLRKGFPHYIIIRSVPLVLSIAFMILLLVVVVVVSCCSWCSYDVDC